MTNSQKETRSVSSTGGAKGVKKQAYALIPPFALRELATLYGNGARKYDAHNFRRGYEQSKSYSALQRHANLFWAGENIDIEMQLSHLSSVAWHIFALIESQQMHPEFDDREYDYKGEDFTRAGLAYRENDENMKEPERVIEGLTARYDLIPLRPLAMVAEVYGALGTPEMRDWGIYYSFLQQYVNAYWSGYSIDEQTGFHNLALAAYYAFTLLDFSANEDAADEALAHDDRYIVGAAYIGFNSDPASV